VAITGTTFIVETSRAGRNRVVMLEGSSRVSLNKVRGQTRDVRGGQALEVPAGATTLPMPVDIDLEELMRKHPLITEFPPLPSRDAILATARNQRPPGDEPIYQGRPAGGGGIPPIFAGLPFPGIQIGGGRGAGGRPVTTQPTGPTNPSPGGGKPGTTVGTGAATTGTVQANPGGNQPAGPILRTAPVRRAVPRATATPPPIR
jgi:hypothetical protein